MGEPTTLAELGYTFNPETFRYEVRIQGKLMSFVALELVDKQSEPIIVREIFRMWRGRGV